jgi:hypothetical protein
MVFVLLAFVWAMDRLAPRNYTIHPGEKVTLRAGFAFVVPPGVTGSMSSWRSVASAAGDAVDDVELRHDPTVSGGYIFLSTYQRLSFHGGFLACRSTHDLVEVRWMPPSGDILNVHVVTRLPGRLAADLMFADRSATNAYTAWLAAERMLRHLSVTGVALPPAPAQTKAKSRQ